MADRNHEQDLPYTCVTQQDDELPLAGSGSDFNGPPSINVGINDANLGPIVPRWDVSSGNTKLQYFVDTNTFTNLAATEADFATTKLQEAADEWNSLGLGLTISQAASATTSHFSLIYQQNKGQLIDRRLAEAFFPNDPNRFVIVTDLALDQRNRGILKNVFLHELGHVLGLRHEFALDKKQQLKLGVIEDVDGAVKFKGRNSRSVMNYTAKPTLRKSDKAAVREFYKLAPGHVIAGGSGPVTVFVP